MKGNKRRGTYLGFFFKLSFRLWEDKKGEEKALIAGDVVETEELSV